MAKGFTVVRAPIQSISTPNNIVYLRDCVHSSAAPFVTLKASFHARNFNHFLNQLWYDKIEILKKESFMLGLPRGAEWIIILVIVVLLFGPGRIGKIAGELGRSIKNFREGLGNKEEESQEPEKKEEVK
jgi:sec-independent protein translocase protein TatA